MIPPCFTMALFWCDDEARSSSNMFPCAIVLTFPRQEPARHTYTSISTSILYPLSDSIRKTLSDSIRLHPTLSSIVYPLSSISISISIYGLSICLSMHVPNLSVYLFIYVCTYNQ